MDTNETLNEMFDGVILNNELSGILAAAYRFSHASGGTSGWSFGRCQFDVKNNASVPTLLRKLGFTNEEMNSIITEAVDPRQWNARLVAGSAIIDEADTAQLSYCLNKALNFDTTYGIEVESPSGILAGADYCNQYGSEGNGAVIYYKALKRAITAQDVLNFKLTQTKYGRENPEDCKRRFNGVMKVVNAA
jgi:hypothetical protein